MTWAVALAAATGPADTLRVAVIVGENESVSGTMRPLKYADDDAIMADELLRAAGVETTLLVDVDRDTRSLFSNIDIDARVPTRQNLDSALDDVFRRIRSANEDGRSTELFFVYSGHGDVSHGEGFVALADGKLTRTDLYERILARSEATRNHVIIDACRSYFLVFGKGRGGDRQPYDLELSSVRDRFDNTGFVLSTSADQESHEWSRLRSGIFSYEVRSGLRGAADVDLDSRITYRELGAFVQSANAAIQNARYRPQAIVVPPRSADLETVVLAWSTPTERIDVPPDATLGHMYVEDADGHRLADAHPGPSQQLSLIMPERRPLFLRRGDGATEYVLAARGSIVVSSTTARTVEVGAKGSLHLAFEQLFATPFTTDAVAAFDASIDVPSLTLDTSPPPTSVAKTAAPFVAGGAAALGVVMTVAAIVVRQGAPPQTEVLDTNRRLRTYNTIAITSYAIAGAAAIAYLVLELGE